ncbi:MAG: DUF1573 domain-containing protein [Aureispira sp.]|nr:DUF1573 domain-containing protein [Aureispira sp.]
MYKVVFILIGILSIVACGSETPPIETPIDIVDTTTKVVVPEVDTTTVDTMSVDTTTIDSSKIPQRIEKPSLTPPQIKFEHTEYSYDTITAGDVIQHVFKFTNEGDKPLEIKKVEASCGCTSPAYPFVLIAKGESNTITAKFDSKGKSGNQEATLTVYTNEPKAHTLILDGYVKEK